MGFVDGLKRLLRGVADSFLAVVGFAWEVVASIIGCVVGVIGLGFENLWNLIANSGGRQRLSSQTRAIMSRFFPDVDLGDVELRLDSSLPIPPGMQGMTIGNTIFLRDGFNEWDPDDMSLLMHELVHVDQYRRAALGSLGFACEYGAGTLARFSYEDNPLEVEAVGFEKAHRQELRDAVANEDRLRAELQAGVAAERCSSTSR